MCSSSLTNFRYETTVSLVPAANLLKHTTRLKNLWLHNYQTEIRYLSQLRAPLHSWDNGDTVMINETYVAPALTDIIISASYLLKKQWQQCVLLTND